MQKEAGDPYTHFSLLSSPPLSCFLMCGQKHWWERKPCWVEADSILGWGTAELEDISCFHRSGGEDWPELELRREWYSDAWVRYSVWEKVSIEPTVASHLLEVISGILCCEIQMPCNLFYMRSRKQGTWEYTSGGFVLAYLPVLGVIMCDSLLKNENFSSSWTIEVSGADGVDTFLHYKISFEYIPYSKPSCGDRPL